MRNLLIVGLFGLAGCGINEESFADDFVDQYCGTYDACDTSGRPCPINFENVLSTESCAFDADAAKACLSEDYGCDDTIPGLEVVTTPEPCLVVCGQTTTPE